MFWIIGGSLFAGLVVGCILGIGIMCCLAMNRDETGAG